MKTFLRSGALLCAFFFSATFLAYPQGSLTPPDAPAPTMQTLDQLGAKLDALVPKAEARIIVNATNTPGDAANTFIILQPGSYYLTGNVAGDSGKHGISIQADNVTLDLNGFALISGGSGTVRGVDVPAGQVNLCVRNGTVGGWSDGGVRAELTENVLAEKLRLSANSGSIGLYVGLGSLIKDCLAIRNATGFRTVDRCQISNCIATENTADGFSCTSYVTLIDCTASRNSGSGIVLAGGGTLTRCGVTRNQLDGITEGGGSTIADCTAVRNVRHGINAGDGSTVRNCAASANSVQGIVVTNDCHVVGNNCEANKNGIVVDAPTISGGVRNRIDDNSCNNNEIGVLVNGLSNLVIRNRAAGNTVAPFSVASPTLNQIGPFVSGGGTISSTSPWANFQQ